MMDIDKLGACHFYVNEINLRSRRNDRASEELRRGTADRKTKPNLATRRQSASIVWEMNRVMTESKKAARRAERPDG